MCYDHLLFIATHTHKNKLHELLIIIIIWSHLCTNIFKRGRTHKGETDQKHVLDLKKKKNTIEIQV